MQPSHKEKTKKKKKNSKRNRLMQQIIITIQQTRIKIAWVLLLTKQTKGLLKTNKPDKVSSAALGQETKMKTSLYIY